jgi:dihydrofolate reductase
MRKIVVNISLTLDGVMQAPGRPDEDRRGGFEHGGWATPYFDEVMGKVASEGSDGSSILLGRRTYEDLASVWPDMPEDNPFTKLINETRKYVVSSTLKAPLSWNDSQLVEGDAMDAVATLKEDGDDDLVVLGSGQLVRSLMERSLIDQYRLLIHPLVLGSGLRLFAEGTAFAALELVDTVTSTTGVIIATYEPAKPKEAR